MMECPSFLRCAYSSSLACTTWAKSVFTPSNISKNSSEELSLTAAYHPSTGERIIELNSLPVEIKLEGHLLYIENKDVPKVVGEIGYILGEKGVNIASLQLVRKEKGGNAYTILNVDQEVPQEVMETLMKKPFILKARKIFLS